ATLATAFALRAQYAMVVYEPERNFLNEGQPLPAETRWMLTGPISDRMHIAEVRVYERADMKKLLHTARWERTEWNADKRFIIPVDHKLEGNDTYTIVLEFFEPVPHEVTMAVSEELERYLSAYIDESFEVGRSRAKLLKPVSEVMEDMALIMRRGTSNYRSRLAQPFPGFSQLVEDKLRKVNETSLSMSRFSIKSSEATDKREKRIEFARQQMASVKEVVRGEVASYFQRELMILRDRAVIADQPTEKVKHIIALNLGYGGIYNSGQVEDLSYSGAPFLGLSFPLGKMALNSRFVSNSSISAGIFLNNVEDQFGKEVTGPLVGRPIYGAYGYRLFRMVRLNAGAAVLQKATIDAQQLDINKIYLSPFVGVSLEINLWLGLER
ncbi:MAG TPA: hypothetical protein PLS30_14825, partial [Flavobacteriales bacterium]|nr:hypothetical protein [Flavobacteriales bacterium]